MPRSSQSWSVWWGWAQWINWANLFNTWKKWQKQLSVAEELHNVYQWKWEAWMSEKWLKMLTHRETLLQREAWKYSQSINTYALYLEDELYDSETSSHRSFHSDLLLDTLWEYSQENRNVFLSRFYALLLPVDELVAQLILLWRSTLSDQWRSFFADLSQWIDKIIYLSVREEELSHILPHIQDFVPHLFEKFDKKRFQLLLKQCYESDSDFFPRKYFSVLHYFWSIPFLPPDWSLFFSWELSELLIRKTYWYDHENTNPDFQHILVNLLDGDLDDSAFDSLLHQLDERCVFSIDLTKCALDLSQKHLLLRQIKMLPWNETSIKTTLNSLIASMMTPESALVITHIQERFEQTKILWEDRARSVAYQLMTLLMIGNYNASIQDANTMTHASVLHLMKENLVNDIVYWDWKEKTLLPLLQWWWDMLNVHDYEDMPELQMMLQSFYDMKVIGEKRRETFILGTFKSESREYNLLDEKRYLIVTYFSWLRDSLMQGFSLDASVIRWYWVADKERQVQIESDDFVPYRPVGEPGNEFNWFDNVKSDYIKSLWERAEPFFSSEVEYRELIDEERHNLHITFAADHTVLMSLVKEIISLWLSDKKVISVPWYDYSVSTVSLIDLLLMHISGLYPENENDTDVSAAKIAYTDLSYDVIETAIELNDTEIMKTVFWKGDATHWPMKEKLLGYDKKKVDMLWFSAFNHKSTAFIEAMLEWGYDRSEDWSWLIDLEASSLSVLEQYFSIRWWYMLTIDAATQYDKRAKKNRDSNNETLGVSAYISDFPSVNSIDITGIDGANFIEKQVDKWLSSWDWDLVVTFVDDMNILQKRSMYSCVTEYNTWSSKDMLLDETIPLDPIGLSYGQRNTLKTTATPVGTIALTAIHMAIRKWDLVAFEFLLKTLFDEWKNIHLYEHIPVVVSWKSDWDQNLKWKSMIHLISELDTELEASAFLDLLVMYLKDRKINNIGAKLFQWSEYQERSARLIEQMLNHKDPLSNKQWWLVLYDRFPTLFDDLCNRLNINWRSSTSYA